MTRSLFDAPPSRRIFTAFAARDRLNACEEFLKSCGSQEVLLVGATRMAVDELARRLSVNSGGVFGLHRYSLGALAVDVASPQLAMSGKSVLAGIAVDALAARAVQDCRAGEGLAWFEPVASTPGFFRALASTLSELRLNAVDVQALREAGPSGADLSRLIVAYQKFLAEAGLADSAEIFRTAAGVAAGSEYRFRGAPLVLLDITARSHAEQAFVQALLAQAGSVLAICTSRDDATLTFLQTVMNVEPDAEAQSDATALNRLRQYIFSPSPPREGVADASFEFRSATDEARESVEIARSILFAADAGTPFDRVAILLRNPEAYQPLVEDALRRAGIPAYFSHGTRRPNPAGRAFLALLACAAEGLTASRFSEYLSLGQVPEPDPQGEPPKRAPEWTPVQGELFPQAAPVEERPAERPETGREVRAPQAWERLLVDAAVIGGRERWARRLDGLEREFDIRIEELRGEDEPRLAYAERQRDRLRDLRRFALPLITALDELPRNALWNEWLDALERLAAISLRQPEAVLSALGELRPMGSAGPATLDEVREVLADRLTFLRSDPTERRYGKVFVATISEAAGMLFHTVFLPGLGEDLFPRKAFEDPLLLDIDRQRVSPYLMVQNRRVAEERLLLHAAAGAAEERLCISYPRMNLGQGRSRGPSFYAIEVVRAVTGRVPDLQQLQRMAADASRSHPGWPSPISPANAIDNTEYDLAIVRKLTRMAPEERKGAARYLLSANDNLQRSLQARWQRWSPKWSQADGIVDPDHATMTVLEQNSPKRRPYSATALQQFAVCPYRFLLHAILRLEVRPEAVPLERIDPLTKGRLLHDVQYRLLTKLQDMKLLPVSKDNHDAVTRVADDVFDATALEYRELLAPAIPRVWETEVEDLRWDLLGWIRMLADTHDGWVPKWFELSFGLGSPPVTLPDGTKVRGAIDMIEELDGRLRITDHKTGRPQTVFGFTKGGEVLQPLLYAEAAEALLGKPAAATRLSYCTQRGGYRIDEIAMSDEGARHLSHVIESIEGSLLQGFVPAAPRHEGCKYCDYRIVCGPYEETRIKQKRLERLRLLEQLRSTP